MAQAAMNPKIEELRFRLKTDPKSRIFYQLAEELRKTGQFAEAEQILRSGLSVYPTYLAAWVSLGRVQRDTKNEGGAVESLNKALQLDPSNVVAARLLADAYRSLGQPVEALKKYKLVHALMPADEELKAAIEALERELDPPRIAAPEPEAVAPVEAEPLPQVEETPVPATPMDAGNAFIASEESPFDKTAPPFAEETGDAEPMLLAHDESPFEEPAETATLAAFGIEDPIGMHVDPTPVSAEVPAEVPEPAVDASDVFAPAPAEQPAGEDVGNTLTMADLYVRQGLVHEASHIYENLLARDPANSEIRARLDAISPHVNPKIEKLERWLSRVARKETGRV